MTTNHGDSSSFAPGTKCNQYFMCSKSGRMVEVLMLVVVAVVAVAAAVAAVVAVALVAILITMG